MYRDISLDNLPTSATFRPEASIVNATTVNRYGYMYRALTEPVYFGAKHKLKIGLEI